MYNNVFLFVNMTKPKTNIVLELEFITVSQTEADRSKFSLSFGSEATCRI